MSKAGQMLALAVAATTVMGGSSYYVSLLSSRLTTSQNTAALLQAQMASQSARIAELESEDQRVKNRQLADTISQITDTYTQSVAAYMDLVDLKLLTKNTAKFDAAYAASVNLLAGQNYASAAAQLTKLSADVAAEKDRVIASIPTPTNLPVTNTPPTAGYSRQTVTTDGGNFVVSLVSADLGTTRVIVDTASDSDCATNCPVLPLATYVARNGAYAGVNGSYFCPAAYPTCTSKTNSFDLLVMNKNKHYLNSGNNVYSANPAVIFGPGYVRFVAAVSQWGRDTGVDGVLSNYPLLLLGGNITFGGNDDPKQGSRGNRSFVGNKANAVYIGVVHSATVAQSARALKALGLENALNLDDGGSTALFSGGYKVGPGRDLPNVILFVKK